VADPRKKILELKSFAFLSKCDKTIHKKLKCDKTIHKKLRCDETIHKKVEMRCKNPEKESAE
jgi:hypothetical protein